MAGNRDVGSQLILGSSGWNGGTHGPHDPGEASVFKDNANQLVNNFSHLHQSRHSMIGQVHEKCSKILEVCLSSS